MYGLKASSAEMGGVLPPTSSRSLLRMARRMTEWCTPNLRAHVSIFHPSARTKRRISARISAVIIGAPWWRSG
jgi:hypothetical protein